MIDHILLMLYNYKVFDKLSANTTTAYPPQQPSPTALHSWQVPPADVTASTGSRKIKGNYQKFFGGIMLYVMLLGRVKERILILYWYQL
jgi:hypothetical protein